MMALRTTDFSRRPKRPSTVLIRSVFTQGFPGELLKALGLKRRHGVLALELIGDAIGRTHGLGEHFSDAVGEGLIDLRRHPLPARLAGFRNERIDRIEHRLHLLVSKEHGAEHLIFRELFCFRFHHKHRLTRTSNGHVEGRGLQRFKARIQQILTIGEAHASGTEGPMPKGMPETARAAAAPIMAITSGSWSLSADITVQMTCTSFIKPFGKSGRIGRSMSRLVSVSFSEGRPSRRKNPQGFSPRRRFFPGNSRSGEERAGQA